MKLLNDSEIEVQMQQEIERAYSQPLRERIMRSGTAKEKANLKAFFAAMHDLKLRKIAERDFAQALHDYDTAVVRVAQPALDPADYPDITDIDGNVIPNPALAVDATERTAAQAIINGASQAVLDAVAARVVV